MDRQRTGEKPVKKAVSIGAALGLAAGAAFAFPAGAQEILPFPPKLSGSIAGRTVQDSVYSPLPATSRLPKDAPIGPIGVWGDNFGS